MEMAAAAFDGAHRAERVVATFASLRLLFWGTMGALAGGSIGASHDSAFKPIIDDLEGCLAPDASMLVLVGETAAIDSFVSAGGAGTGDVLRQPLTGEQAAEPSQAVPSPA